MQQAIAYLRVSTDEQGKSGLGLEAQRDYIERWAEREGIAITGWRNEVASGSLGLDDRPVLKATLAACKKAKCLLVVHKLDRLSRDASFILNMMNTKAKFVVAELGIDVDPIMLHFHAIIAERERKLIGERTKAALARLKAKGALLGSHHPSHNPDSLVQGRATRTAKADAFAESLRWVVVDMVSRCISVEAMAAELTSKGLLTSTGLDTWSHKQTSRLLERLGYGDYTTLKVSKLKARERVAKGWKA